MKVGGMIFTLGMFIMCIGVGFEDLATSFAISWFGLFMTHGCLLCAYVASHCALGVHYDLVKHRRTRT